MDQQSTQVDSNEYVESGADLPVEEKRLPIVIKRLTIDRPLKR